MKRKKIELNVRDKRVALSLPFLIFSFLALAIVFAQNNIQATVIVAPSITIECQPDSLAVGSNLKWINCFIEMTNADVHDIDPANVQLTILGKTGSVPADTTFKQFGDFDSDGETDIMLRFSKSSADSKWFNALPQTTSLTFNLLGSVNEIPFSGTDPVLVIKTTYSFARFIQLNSPNTDQSKIDWLYGPAWFDYRNYTPTYLHSQGYFYNLGGSRIFGMTEFYSKGYLKVEKIYHYVFFDVKRIENQPVTISAIMRDYSDCSADLITKDVHCEGSAILTISKDGTFERYQVNVDNFGVDVKNYKATVEGGRIWNDIIKVSNMTITNIYIS